MRISQLKLRKICVGCHDDSLAGYVQLVNGVHVTYCAVCERYQGYNLSYLEVYGTDAGGRETRFVVSDDAWRRMLVRDRTCVWDNAHVPGGVTADDFIRQVLIEEIGPEAEDLLSRLGGDELRCRSCQQFLPGLELAVPQSAFLLLNPRSRAQILDFIKLVSWHPDHGVPISLARRSQLNSDEEAWITDRACMLSCYRCNRSRRDAFSAADREALLRKLRDRLALDVKPWNDEDERMYAVVCFKIAVAAKRSVA